MKIILAGSSGFIGTEVLRQCLAHPSITSLIALSRRDLPVSDPKLKTVLVDDWTSYEPQALKDCEGAEACIWTLGVKTSDIGVQKKVTLDYTLAAATAFSRLPHPAANPGAKASAVAAAAPFRFVFASGILAVRDQSKALWFAAGARHIKGEAENQLADFSARQGEDFDSYVVRPGGVLAREAGLAGVAVALGAPAVGVTELAAVMVELAVRGAPEKVWENKELGVRGRELLGEMRG